MPRPFNPIRDADHARDTWSRMRVAEEDKGLISQLFSERQRLLRELDQLTHASVASKFDLPTTTVSRLWAVWLEFNKEEPRPGPSEGEGGEQTRRPGRASKESHTLALASSQNF